LEGLKGIAVVADDILVYGTGSNDRDAMADHDKNLENLFKRCREKNLKLNKTKMRLKQEEIIYIGHKISKLGVEAD